MRWTPPSRRAVYLEDDHASWLFYWATQSKYALFPSLLGGPFIEKRAIAMGATMILSKQKKNYIVKPRRGIIRRFMWSLRMWKTNVMFCDREPIQFFLNNASWSSMFNTWSRFVVLLEPLLWLARSIQEREEWGPCIIVVGLSIFVY